jgi:hypothetical protein
VGQYFFIRFPFDNLTQVSALRIFQKALTQRGRVVKKMPLNPGVLAALR